MLDLVGGPHWSYGQDADEFTLCWEFWTFNWDTTIFSRWAKTVYNVSGLACLASWQRSFLSFFLSWVVNAQLNHRPVSK